MCTSVGLLPSLFLIPIPFAYLFIMKISHFLLSVGYGYFMVFLFWYPLGLYSMQELSYLDRFMIVSLWFRMKLTQIMTWVYKDFLTLTYFSHINIWWALQFWYPWVGSLIPLLMLIIETVIGLCSSPTLVCTPPTQLTTRNIVLNHYGSFSNDKHFFWNKFTSI